MPSKTDPDLSRRPTILGTKDKYTVNELTLMMPGDILVLYTDGLKEHSNDQGDYFPGRLEAKIRECKKEHARRILHEICRDVLSFCCARRRHQLHRDQKNLIRWCLQSVTGYYFTNFQPTTGIPGRSRLW